MYAPTGCIVPAGQADATSIALANTVLNDKNSQITMWKVIAGIMTATAGTIYYIKVMRPDRAARRGAPGRAPFRGPPSGMATQRLISY